MRVVILGCGRVGSRLALLMEQDGYDVSIIDSDPNAFNRLPETFSGQTILGTGIDVDVLKSAGIEEADVFAAVTNYDNTNIMACEVAKEIFNVPKVLARIYDPGRESFYHELGLETVCPTTLVATAVHRILSEESEVTQSDKPQPVGAAPASSSSAASPAVPARTANLAANPPSGNGAVIARVATGTSNQGEPGESNPTRPPGDPSEPAREDAAKTHRGLRGFFRSQS